MTHIPSSPPPRPSQYSSVHASTGRSLAPPDQLTATGREGEVSYSQSLGALAGEGQLAKLVDTKLTKEEAKEALENGSFEQFPALMISAAILFRSCL